MAAVTNRLIELFRNLRSDAVPNPPRPENEQESSTNYEDPLPQPNANPSPGKNENDEDDHEEIVFEKDDFMKDDDKKPKFDFPFKSKKNKGDPKEPKDPKSKSKKNTGSYSSVNTQATGSVFNLVNSSGIQIGSNHVYYMSSSKKAQKNVDEDDDEDHIEKDNLITLLMESSVEPTHKYIDFVSKNLGLNWKSLFISMGYLKGRIETLVAEKGITEARYFLLEDWARNADDASLGRLASLLWDEGERQIVRELSLIYKENKK